MLQDDHTKTTFEGSLKRETVDAILAPLGVPLGFKVGAILPIMRTVLVTALGALPREAKADLIQFLYDSPSATREVYLGPLENSPW